MGKFTALVGMATVSTLLSGCVSMGTNFDPAAVGMVQAGMTESEVVGLLGKPNSRSRTADGKEVWVWLYSRGTALGSARSRLASILFDQHHRVIRVQNMTETELR
ncbi:outer membrane protein assembly factor BamE [Blastomonas sp.]|uniref:outer membrane protein assembly factor BamE domain-containing protein n=1 Tax=Blastomonas sp. TaxID=1909299 RepID=UPI00260B5F5A|nr:outer membrane protein assembly factor BamE [Blastomonas sp.]MDM7956026.1 outer membrane protein assembly factor BamE [Blastomonas sp.]